MSKKAIWLIIFLMGASLIGVAVIQMYWIKWSVNLDEKNFDDQIVMTLNRVRDRLMDDAKQAENDALDFWRPNAGELFKKEEDKSIVDDLFKDSKSNWQKQRFGYELATMKMILDANATLENIDRKNLETYLEQEFKNQSIDLKYDYGVYSNETNSFFIVNGNYVAQIGDDGRSSKGEENLTFAPSEYQVDLFNTDSGSPGYLKVFFPQKNTWIWRSVRPIMLSSILFTGLIIFCFVYTLYVILRQKKVSEMKTDFINNMTHEFKTPIATISLASDSITSPMVSGDESKVKRFANIIKQENQRMLRQVEKVLQMAKIDKQEFELKITEVNMHEVIKRAAENINLRVVKREGDLQLALNAQKHIVQGDHTHISNILNNLLDNAEKYTERPPVILIETKNYSSGIEVSITDNGIGMNKDAQKHIFEKFYRVHTGNIHNVKGFGLGLSYVKAMMQAHNGQVKVKSELGQGSTFFLYFPFKNDVT